VQIFPYIVYCDFYVLDLNNNNIVVVIIIIIIVIITEGIVIVVVVVKIWHQFGLCTQPVCHVFAMFNVNSSSWQRYQNYRSGLPKKNGCLS